VDAERVRAILQGVLLAQHLAGQLARLAQRYEGQVQRQRQLRAEEEAASLEAGDSVQLQRRAVLQKQLDARLVGGRVQQQRGDVLELDACGAVSARRQSAGRLAPFLGQSGMTLMDERTSATRGSAEADID
jgi:hypothetical protein